MELLHKIAVFTMSQTYFLECAISRWKPSQRRSEMKAHIEQDYNVCYIPSFQLNIYHFPERATISTTPFSNLDPGQMVWSPSLSIPTVALVTSVTYRGRACAKRAHQDSCLTLWGGLRFKKHWGMLQLTIENVGKGAYALNSSWSSVKMKCFTVLT